MVLSEISKDPPIVTKVRRQLIEQTPHFFLGLETESCTIYFNGSTLFTICMSYYWIWYSWKGRARMWFNISLRYLAMTLHFRSQSGPLAVLFWWNFKVLLNRNMVKKADSVNKAIRKTLDLSIECKIDKEFFLNLPLLFDGNDWIAVFPRLWEISAYQMFQLVKQKMRNFNKFN